MPYSKPAASAPSSVEKEIAKLRDRINRELITVFPQTQPKSLYEPARYIITGSGKRIRPILVIIGAKCISNKVDAVMPVALAVEILHNFTLVHDDIMDKADLRHGRETVHKKWDIDTAILSGDVMHAISYQLITRSKVKNPLPILDLFLSATITVCDGQAFDKEFETRHNVTLPEYLTMIDYKTGRLISAALEMGGLAVGATSIQAKALRDFGSSIGRAFQIQDDLLDVMGGEKSGKTVGGDIIEGKKTFLLLKSLELAKGKDRALLQTVIKEKGIDKSRVPEVKAVFEKCGAVQEAKNAIETEYNKALKLASKLPNKDGRDMLLGLAAYLMKRDY
ncbi:MAG: polyprenyl synthetase family protein [Chloroherpetonaceae bacterium]|nr:polyprenyl synthetase family protein [Chloroherpetonaceae bacterium]